MSRQIKTNVKNWFFGMLLMFSLVMMLGLKLMIHFQVDLLMREVRLLEVERDRLLSEREKMLTQVNRLKNIDRISKIAEQKLGLTTDPEPSFTIRLEKFSKVEHLKKEFAQKQGHVKRDYQVAGIK
ncbi:hypothetical protein [Caldithrix abyssi]|uniref:Cell division protein FtsL n=1 Tax=Caldithrix abyssi DSM 13497 TaxID=880073 RepID=H1XY42_CALAY|nr:hypothetical protein [Caldithrix abyssi]APF17911.1 hypothetical protein Cabys_1162 [Caldithrix abyssi DSM 13497]EHO41969.1 hypothetical protein Calab_2359 [Caldithrix abyssi DSM 13497]